MPPMIRGGGPVAVSQVSQVSQVFQVSPVSPVSQVSPAVLPGIRSGINGNDARQRNSNGDAPGGGYGDRTHRRREVMMYPTYFLGVFCVFGNYVFILS